MKNCSNRSYENYSCEKKFTLSLSTIPSDIW